MDILTQKNYTLSEKDFYNELENNSLTNLWGAGSIEINGIEYQLTKEQEKEVERISDLIQGEEITKQIRFEQECNRYNEIGF